MTVDTAATSSPEPFPESAESETRLTRLHDALKQLRAKSTATMPLSSLAPGVSAAPAVAEPVLPPLRHEAPQAAEVSFLAPADQLQPAKEPFDLEAWFSNVDVRQYRQLAGNLALHVASGEPAVFAVAALSCRCEGPTLAARLALCLAERQEGEVLIIEPSKRRLRRLGAATSASLIDVVAGRATWSDALAPAEMPSLSVMEFGSQAAGDDVPMSEQWRTALADLKRRFRYVVGGLGPGESGAGDAWLAAIDGVYLAVGLGDASRSVVAKCQARLKTCGARLLGSIALR